MIKRLASWQSPFLYVRLTFWFLTIIISLLPFVLAETRFFNGFDTTLTEFYHKHYQGVLAVFIVTITTSMFDVLSLLILLVTFKSYIAVPAVIIMGALALFLLIFGVALGGAIMAEAGTMRAFYLPMMMLPFSAFVCLVATGFVAVLSNDYAPQREGEVR